MLSKKTRLSGKVFFTFAYRKNRIRDAHTQRTQRRRFIHSEKLIFFQCQKSRHCSALFKKLKVPFFGFCQNVKILHHHLLNGRDYEFIRTSHYNLLRYIIKPSPLIISCQPFFLIFIVFAYCLHLLFREIVPPPQNIKAGRK